MPADDYRKAVRNNWADIFLDYNRWLVALVACFTIVLGVRIPQLEIDTSLRSMLVTGSPACAEYENFRSFFGDEDYILVAIRNERGVDNDRALESLQSITSELGRLEKVESVLSLSNFEVFQKKGQRYGNLPLLRSVGGSLSLPETNDLETLRRALPDIDFLISENLRTVGIVVKPQSKWKYDVPAIRELMSEIVAVVNKNLPEDSESRIIGGPVLRQAVPKYSVRTAFIFGALCSIVCTVVTFYMFRGTKVTIMTVCILGVCVVWIAGLMSLLGISLNASTSISFGLILITTLEIVIHMVTRFYQFSQWVENKDAAIRETVRYLARPCLVSAATTAVGFASCMLTPIPMVFQLGLIMSVGVMIAFFIAMILTPRVIASFGNLDRAISTDRNEDLLSWVLTKMKHSIRRHHRLFTVLGFGLTLVMFCGTPLIRTDPQILRQLGESRPEVKDIAFVEQNLASIHALELLIHTDGKAGSFRKAEIWGHVKELDSRLKQIPEVVATNSLLPYLEYMAALVGSSPAEGDGSLFAPGVLSDVFVITSLTTGGKSMIRANLDEAFEKLRISVRIKNSASVPIIDTIEEVRKAAESVFQGSAKVTVTGEPVVVASQGEDLVRSEIVAMFIAIGIVTLLMMIQMGSSSLGLLSLIPNIPPLATVFGIMGWLKIPLDGVTVFAATVSLGLAVDNTIQFVTQLKRELRLHPDLEVREAMFRAY
ncbi:MAG: MMPL family transporter, partial [Desulfomonile tiedjei]|nr:MMPL family transporter [Desulfomonile tiedjei]